MIDYLRIVTNKAANFDVTKWQRIYLNPIDEINSSPKEHGLMGYNRHVETTYGAIYWHETEYKMGVMYQVTGKGMRMQYEDGTKDTELVFHWATKKNIKVPRLDYAWDVFDNPNATPNSVLEHVSMPEVNTWRRQYQIIESKNPRRGENYSADTLYFGSRKSDKFLRVYDKAKELKIDSEMWTRIELELKHERATKALFTGAETGKIGAVCATEVKAMANWNLQWFLDAIESDVIRFKLPKRDKLSVEEYFDNHIMKWLKENAMRLGDMRIRELHKFAEAIYVQNLDKNIATKRAARKRINQKIDND